MPKGKPTGKPTHASETPLMKQYNAIKAKYPETLLLFRVGDFYETFSDDAIRASKVLGITLTKRANGAASEIELAGFPHHALDTYLPRLVKAGVRVAVCDQLEDPKLAKGIVKRGVTEIVTPGTAMSESLLERATANYLAAIHLPEKGRFGAALLEASTGEFFCLEGVSNRLDALLSQLQPTEILLPRSQLRELRELLGESLNFFRLEDWIFQPAYTTEQLLRHFNTTSLKGFGVEDLRHGTTAAGAILHYLKENEHQHLGHIRALQPFDEGHHLLLDRFTLRNLELLRPMQPESKSLVEVLDHTQTAMGARLLRRWLAFPLRARHAIESRYDCVGALTTAHETRAVIRQQLARIADLERLAMRLATLRLTPREAATIRQSLEALAPLAQQAAHPAFEGWRRTLPDVTDALRILQQQLADDPPADLAKGGVLREGVHAELDEYRAIQRDAKAYLEDFRQRESVRSGIASLKVQYNRVFGYYIEVSKANAARVPDDYIRRQTLTGAERYITPELKTFEDKMLRAEENLFRLEAELYQGLLQQLQPQVSTLQAAAQRVAELDVYASLAQQAVAFGYTRPTLLDSDVLEITQGRHPVIETLLPRDQPYVPNDLRLDGSQQQLLLITGPNMAGKSALLRQTALLVILAQMGSFVPAQHLETGLFDKVFSRVGASDNLAAGESTFMVEMQETARILNQATPRSLVLLDEIGRGTATFDGVSIAWALVEYLHNTPERAAKTLFATHYHELAVLADRLERVQNFTVAVRELSGRIIFLRTLVPGSSEHSFGIQVAEMAGIPPSLILRAQELLAHFENQSTLKLDESPLAPVVQQAKNIRKLPSPPQLQLFSLYDEAAMEVRRLLDGVDVNTLTPIEALLKLQEIQQALAKVPVK